MILRPCDYVDLGCAACLFGCGTMGRGTAVEALTDVPPKPYAMERVLAFNRGRHAVEAGA